MNVDVGADASTRCFRATRRGPKISWARRHCLVPHCGGGVHARRVLLRGARGAIPSVGRRLPIHETGEPHAAATVTTSARWQLIEGPSWLCQAFGNPAGLVVGINLMIDYHIGAAAIARSFAGYLANIVATVQSHLGATPSPANQIARSVATWPTSRPRYSRT